MKKTLLLLPLILALGACATDGKKAGQKSKEPVMITSAYQCGGVKGPAVKFIRAENFADMAAEEAKAVIEINGAPVNMHRVAAPAGIALAADDEQDATKFSYTDESFGVLSFRKEVNGKKVKKITTLKCIAPLN